MRQALLGEQHPRARRLGGAHHHGVARCGHVEIDARLVERRADAADVVALEPGIEHGHLRAAEIIGAADDGEDHGDADRREGDQTLRAEFEQVAPQAIGLLVSGHACPYALVGFEASTRRWLAKLARSLRPALNEGCGRPATGASSRPADVGVE